MSGLPKTPEALAKRVLAGDVRAASRLMRDADDRRPSAIPALRALFPHTGKAFVVGITGSPGAGKSTLTDRLVAHLRADGKKVGVLAVDPTSPFTGGAILGDRIRMQAHATDDGVFIRSLATRGNLGGLSRATGDCIRVMDAMGQDVVIVETVGVGQDELDVARMAHTTVVVVVPGMGDDIQAIKAGILEVADVFAVNKADLSGAERTVRELRGMLELRHAVRAPPMAASSHSAAAVRSPRSGSGKAPGSASAASSKAASAASGRDDWEPPILKVVAARDEGVAELWEGIVSHRAHLEESGELAVRERDREAMQFLALLKDRLMERALDRLEEERGELDEVAGRIARREADPYELATALADKLGK